MTRKKPAIKSLSSKTSSILNSLIVIYLSILYVTIVQHVAGPGWLNELGSCRARVAQ
jgi:hypothetical protein